MDCAISLHLPRITLDMATYILLMKTDSLYTFKTYKPVVKNHINKRLKSLQSDLGGEFYGRNDRLSE